MPEVITDLRVRLEKMLPERQMYLLVCLPEHLVRSDGLSKLAELVLTDFLELDAEFRGDSEAFHDAKMIVQAFAREGDHYWEPFIHGARSRASLAGRLRSTPERLELLIARGEVKQIERIIEAHSDRTQRGLLSLASAILLAEQGESNVSSIMRTRAIVDLCTAPPSLREHRCLSHALLTSEELTLPPSWAEYREEGRPHRLFIPCARAVLTRGGVAPPAPRTTVPLWYVVAAYGSTWGFSLIFVLGWAWLVLIFLEVNFAITSAVAVLTPVLSLVASVFFGLALRRWSDKVTWIFAGVAQAFEQAGSRARRILMKRAARFASLLSGVTIDTKLDDYCVIQPWDNVPAYMVVRMLAETESVAEAAYWVKCASHMSERARSAVVYELNSWKQGRRERLYVELARIAEEFENPLHLFRIFISTMDSRPNPTLLHRFLRIANKLHERSDHADSLKDKRDLLSTLRRVHPECLARALLRSLTPSHQSRKERRSKRPRASTRAWGERIRKMVSETYEQLLCPSEPILWLGCFLPYVFILGFMLFMLPGILLFFAVMLVGEGVGMLLCRTYDPKRLVSQCAGQDWRRRKTLIKKAMDKPPGVLTPGRRAIDMTLLAQEILESDHVDIESEALRTYSLCQIGGVTAKLLHRGLIRDKCEAVLSFLIDLDILDTIQKKANRSVHVVVRNDLNMEEHVRQLQRVLPVPSLWLNLTLVVVLSWIASAVAIVTAFWVAPLEAQRYLMERGWWEIPTMVTYLAVLQHVFRSEGGEALRLFGGAIIGIFIIGGSVLALLPLEANGIARGTVWQWSFWLMTLFLVNGFVPELIAEARGRRLLYPTRKELLLCWVISAIGLIGIPFLFGMSTATGPWGLLVAFIVPVVVFTLLILR